MMTPLRAFVLCVAFLFAGCQSLDYTVARRSDIDKQIAAARAETESHLKVLNDQQLSLLQQAKTLLEARQQAAADALFKGAVTFSTLKDPMSRADMVMGQSIQLTATQLPAASPAAQAKAFEELKIELDEAKMTAQQLKTQYDAELSKARLDGAAKDKALTEIATSLKHVEDEKVAVLTKAKDTEANLSDARKQADDAIIAAKTKEVENAKSVQALKTKASAATGILMLICIAGAIWSPAFKDKFGIGAVIFAGLTAAIWYVTGWMVGIAIGCVALVGIVALLAWAVKNHYIESKAATATYLALEQVKTNSAADFDRVVKPALDAYHTKYLKDGTTVPDPSITAHIDQRLMAADAK